MGVDEDVEGAETVKEREEGHAGCDLADDVPNLKSYLLFVLDSLVHQLAFLRLLVFS